MSRLGASISIGSGLAHGYKIALYYKQRGKSLESCRYVPCHPADAFNPAIAPICGYRVSGIYGAIPGVAGTAHLYLGM